MAADTWGRYNILIIAGISSAVLTIASIAAKDTSSILVVGGECWTHRNQYGRPDNPMKALYGFTSGSIISMQAACIPPLLVGPPQLYLQLILIC